MLDVGGGAAVGCEVTVTVAVWPADPPRPVQDKLYDDVAASPPVLCVPEVAFVPDHAPEAVHTVALAELQERVEELPDATVVGFAESNTLGAGVTAAVMATVTDCVVDPPAPVQVSENVDRAERGPVL